MTATQSYGMVDVAVAAFQHSATTNLAFEDVISTLREQIAMAGLWVLAEINPQHFLQLGGYQPPALRQILFFHPDILAQLLATDAAALVEAPLKFVVIEMPGGPVTVRWLDPEPNFTRYASPAIAQIGARLAADCHRIIDHLVAITAPSNQHKEGGKHDKR